MEHEDGSMIETKHYSDGTSATGAAPLPDLSPEQQNAADEWAEFIEHGRATIEIERAFRDGLPKRSR
jgi:hypothetical protein